MEYRNTINDAHPKPVSCIQYNPFRREIYTAGEGDYSYLASLLRDASGTGKIADRIITLSL